MELLKGSSIAFPFLASDGRRDRKLSEAILEPLEFGCVSFELRVAGPALSQNLAHQHETSDVQQQIVDLPRVHAASSTATGSSTVSTSGTAGFDSTMNAA